MKLDNFKELLLKKSGEQDNLKLLIKYMRDDILVDHIVESLEKMAGSHSKKNPNASVLHFAENMNKFKAGMIHDALSHHASHYKAALKRGDTKLADDHMRQIFKTMHMLEKFTKHGLKDFSQGKLKVEAVDPKPWERHGYLNTNDVGKFKTDTVGWKRNGPSISYDWLRQAPHESYKEEVKRHKHNKAYPLEEMKVNNKYIHIDDDLESPGKFEPHPFDSHPIHKVYNQPPASHKPEHKQKYLEDREVFHSDPQGGKAKYREKIANMSKEDFANFGATKPNQVHEDVPGLDLSDAPKPKISTEDLKARLARIRKMGSGSND